MKDLIFDYYFQVSSSSILSGLVLICIGMLIWPVGSRWKDSLFAVLIYIAIVALGMSGNIKHLSLIGIVHAITAFCIAWLAIRYFANRVSYLLLVPCFFILVVILFNVSSEGRGLELMGRWTKTPESSLSSSAMPITPTARKVSVLR